MEQLGLGMAGFGGDTMHMARLWDSSRQGRGGYSLEALSSERRHAALCHAVLCCTTLCHAVPRCAGLGGEAATRMALHGAGWGG